MTEHIIIVVFDLKMQHESCDYGHIKELQRLKFLGHAATSLCCKYNLPNKQGTAPLTCTSCRWLGSCQGLQQKVSQMTGGDPDCNYAGGGFCRHIWGWGYFRVWEHPDIADCSKSPQSFAIPPSCPVTALPVCAMHFSVLSDCQWPVRHVCTPDHP